MGVIEVKIIYTVKLNGFVRSTTSNLAYARRVARKLAELGTKPTIVDSFLKTYDY